MLIFYLMIPCELLERSVKPASSGLQGALNSEKFDVSLTRAGPELFL